MRVSVSSVMRAVLGVGLCASLTLAAPQAAYPASRGKMVLKIAVTFPRSQKAAIRAKKFNQRIAKMTDGAVQFRVYWGGAAGGERDVLRKMRAGQIDGAPFGLEMVSNFVREALVLQSPGLFMNYKQVDAVRAELTPRFNAEAYRNGFKILGWGDVGRLRLFSKHRVASPEDFRRVRPWLYPESQTLKTLYKLVGATGVPLGIAEVYGAMETGMIDTFWATSVLAGALQWHRTGKYVSGDGLGFVSGAFAVRRQAWDALPEAAKMGIPEIIEEEQPAAQLDLRKDDDKVFEKLLKRGYSRIDATSAEVDAWWALGARLRQHMIGRIYTSQLVAKAEAIALQFADEEQRARLARLRAGGGK